MRLDLEQIDTIIQTVSLIAGLDTSTYLFGSRLNDEARGGDIDLLIESTSPISYLKRARIKLDLENLLSLPVDVITATPCDKNPFVLMIRPHAKLLTIKQPCTQTPSSIASAS